MLQTMNNMENTELICIFRGPWFDTETLEIVNTPVPAYGQIVHYDGRESSSYIYLKEFTYLIRNQRVSFQEKKFVPANSGYFTKKLAAQVTEFKEVDVPEPYVKEPQKEVT